MNARQPFRRQHIPNADNSASKNKAKNGHVS
jgi:hypothetical protein